MLPGVESLLKGEYDERMISAKLLPYFEDYEAYHRTIGNKVCHFIGIPSITVTLLGLLGALSFGPEIGDGLIRLDAGVLLWLGATLWYLTLDWRAGLPFSLCGLGCYFLGRALPFPALWSIFILGWVVQYVGHYVYEKKSPAFYKNLRHILIGPLWIFSKITGYR
jgi:uncharacterized membrane protein YGL010W